jgi:FtsZ-interacting cell division protein ZipA
MNVAMSEKKEGFEDLLQYFISEVFKKGFPPGAAGKKPTNVEDIMEMMRDLKNKKYSQNTANEPQSKEQTVNVNKETVSNKSEVEALKEQIELLKQQLRDKDEIIALLKEKVKNVG